jgi:hypothetical protein
MDEDFSPSPREGRAGRETEGGAVQNAPPLPCLLLHFAEEREPKATAGILELLEFPGRTG